MMKSSTAVLIVDSVETAIKFYTEKLAFDIASTQVRKEEGIEKIFTYALLKKGKCSIIFRTPYVEELAEFSFIKRCASRCTGVYVETKKGLEKYFQKVNKKGVQVLHGLEDKPWGHKTFAIKDPFGFLLTFAQPIEGFQPKKSNDFCGMQISLTDQSGTKRSESDLLDQMIAWLKGFGILRRAAKKYSKLWLKERSFYKK